MHGTFNKTGETFTGEMLVMDRSGHTTVTWDSSKPVEIDVARATFEKLTREGYRAFEVEGANNQGRPMREFDPKAGKIMMVPHLVGG